MKKLISTLFLSVFALSANAQDFTMRLSHVFPPQHPLGRMATAYAEAVNEETKGKVKVEILGSGQAFAEKEAFPAVAKGQIEATMMVSILFSGITPAIDVLSIPYIMKGNEAPKTFLTSPLRDKLDADIRTKRIEPLGWFFQTNSTIFTSNAKPIVTIADFQGLKIRGINRVTDAAFSAANASPLATPGSEVYQALQSGVLDAAMTDPSAAFSRRYYEVQKFGTVVANHLAAYGILYANPEWVKKLPADLQAALKRAASKTEAQAITQGTQGVEKAIKDLREKGMTITVLTQAQASEWEKVMTEPSKKVFLERAGEAGKAVLGGF